MSSFYPKRRVGLNLPLLLMDSKKLVISALLAFYKRVFSGHAAEVETDRVSMLAPQVACAVWRTTGLSHLRWIVSVQDTL